MSDGDVSCTAPVLQTLFKCPTPAFVFKSAAEPSRLVHCREGAESIVPAMKSCVWTCKSAPNMGCFWHFDFEMCLPQPHALFGFSEPTYFFDPPEPQNIGKTQRFATFYLFGAPFSSFYFPLLWLYPLLLLHLSIKSLTSKLPFNRDCVCVFFVGF